MKTPPRDWVNILFLAITPVVGLGGTAWYAATQGIVWWEPVLALALFMAIGIGIGSGYHRCFAHRTYECHPAAESVLLFFGALALQNSALRWARDHRDHHRYTDTDRDPYSVTRGFLWAHVFWVFYQEAPGSTFDNVPDLLKNPRVMWQHRWSSSTTRRSSSTPPPTSGASGPTPPRSRPATTGSSLSLRTERGSTISTTRFRPTSATA
jgi:stearoyl-CoA desaturase (delta-9 desaturase)